MNSFFSKRIKLLAIITLLSSFIYQGTGNDQSYQLSQTVPPDMIYVQESDSVHSFYISATEEPNINWRIYTDYLKTVFIDYPEVYKEALPLQDMQATATRYNDPIIDNYANHPAYNYYPIVGVSWWQIQNYLQWKTDRLNEIILIKNGFLKIYDQQMNEENFNTQSFIEGQFDGVKGNWKAKKPYLDYSNNGYVKKDFFLGKGILIPQYRLPTEAEWDYASLVNKNEISNKENYSIYGTNYFLKLWNSNGKNDIEKKYNPYPTTNTMEAGVQEWLMDMESYEYKSWHGSNDIYRKNGFANIETTLGVYDADGVVDVKDSLGKVRFIFIDYTNTNYPMYVTRIGLPQFENYNEKGVANPYYKNDSLFEAHRKLSNPNRYIANRWYTLDDRNKPFFLYTPSFKQINYDVILYKHKQRKIKLGNWKKPGKQTYLLNEVEASELVGFRCVLPATSLAVEPRYKVKWD